MAEKLTKPASESVESTKKSDYGMNRRTFAKGTGASLALASTFGAFGGNVAAQEDENGMGDEPDEMNGLDTRFREMEREMYVAALAGSENDMGGAGVAVFLPEEEMDDPDGDEDEDHENDLDGEENDDAVDDEEMEVDDAENGPENDEGDVNDQNDVEDENDTNGDNGGPLHYHLFLMNVEDVTQINLHEGAEGEDGPVLESLLDLTEEVDGDDNENGAVHEGLSGTIEEPIVVTGSIGEADDNGEPDDTGEVDLQDFTENPWNYYIAVQGNGDDVVDDEEPVNGNDAVNDENDDEPVDGENDDVANDDDMAENGEEPVNGNDAINGEAEHGDVLLRGQVTTGLLPGEGDDEDLNGEDDMEDDVDEDLNGEDDMEDDVDEDLNGEDDMEDDVDAENGEDEDADNDEAVENGEPS